MKEDVVLGGFDKNNYDPKDYGQRLLTELWCRFPLYIGKVLYRMGKLLFYFMHTDLMVYLQTGIQVSCFESS